MVNFLRSKSEIKSRKRNTLYIAESQTIDVNRISARASSDIVDFSRWQREIKSYIEAGTSRSECDAFSLPHFLQIHRRAGIAVICSAERASLSIEWCSQHRILQITFVRVDSSIGLQFLIFFFTCASIRALIFEPG